jgi:hypothetical protein
VSKQHHQRFIDLNKDEFRKRSDFNPRTRPAIEILCGLLTFCAFVSVCVGVTGLKGTFTGSLVCLAVCAMTLAILLMIRDLRRQVESAEFLNAIFASVLSVDCSFCIVAKINGEIVYGDRGFQQIFQDFQHWPKRDMDSLLVHCRFNDVLRQAIVDTLNEGGNNVVDIPTAAHEMAEPLPHKLLIEASTRPKGYCIVRGRAT